MNRFRPNRRLPDELRRTPAMRARLAVAAEAVRSAARAIAPDGPTGRYKRTLEVEHDGDDTRVVSKDFAGHLVEFGSVNNPPYAPLRRGAEAAGLKLEEHGRAE